MKSISGQAENMAVYGADFLWGCLRMNSTANPPFNEMRQGFAAFKKETRMALGQQDIPELFEKLRPAISREAFFSCLLEFVSAFSRYTRLALQETIYGGLAG